MLNGPILVHGPKAEAFEQKFAEFTGARRAVSVSSCTAAMHLAYFDVGIGPGDEVIVSAQTHTATAHTVELCGAKPVFVDSEPATGNIDIDRIEEAINDRTKAIAVVHFLGMPVNMAKIDNIAKKYGLYVLEDCALAIGSSFRGIHAGLHGNAGCFSFYPVKHITTAEGGMLITNDDALADRIHRKRAFGLDRFIGERKVPGVYDVNMLGFNYRMNEIQAAIGIQQINRVDRFLKARKENYAVLEAGLEPVDEIRLFKHRHEESISSRYCFSFVLSGQVANRRYELVDALNRRGVGTSVYYPKPVPHMTYYREKYGYKDTDFPVAAKISDHSVALPVGPHLDADDMHYIVQSVKASLHDVR